MRFFGGGGGSLKEVFTSGQSAITSWVQPQSIIMYFRSPEDCGRGDILLVFDCRDPYLLQGKITQ